MRDGKLVVKPVAWYDGAQYPQRDTRDGEAVRKSLGKKLGSAMLAAALGLTLAGCDSQGSRVMGPPPMRPDTKTEDAAKKLIDKGEQRHPGPPPVRPDMRTEDDAKKAIAKQAGTKSPADTATKTDR